MQKTLRKPKLQITPLFKFKGKKSIAYSGGDDDPTVGTTTTVTFILTKL